MKNFKRQVGYTLIELLSLGWVVVVLALIGGWVMNIMTIVQHANDPITGMFIFRCVGIFVMPLGGVLGYF